MIELTPLVDLPELHDPAMTGEWVSAFVQIASEPQVPPWCSYLARRDGELVGSGGFKTPPDAAGWVEIGYISFLPSRAQGVATAVAARLVAIAAEEGARGLFAHTLPEHNPSTRVLAANGFSHAGDVIDPDDGPVWRWHRALRR